MNKVLIVIAILGSGWAARADGADKPRPENRRPPQGQTVKVTVVSVKGQCEKLAAGEGAQNWSPVRKGETLGETTVIRTGMRSEVILRFEDRGKIVIGRSSKVGISEVHKRRNLVKTRIGLKYGAMHVTVDSSRGPNDFQVKTPVGILAVRGTSGKINYNPVTGLSLQGQTGTWKALVGPRSRNVNAGESTDGQLTPSMQIELARRDTQVEDVWGVTGGESSFLRENGSGRGLSGVYEGSGKLPTSPGALPTEREVYQGNGEWRYDVPQ